MRCVILLIFVLHQVLSEDDTCKYNPNIFLKKGGSVNVSSPGFEHLHYPKNSYCTWTITAEEGRRLKAHFLSVSLWPSMTCSFDGIVLFDGKSTADPMLGKFCNGNPLKDFLTTGNQLHIVFYSYDFSNPYLYGFLLLVSDLSPEPICSKSELLCRNKKKCISRKYICDGQDDCGDGTDEEECRYLFYRRVPCGKPEIPSEIDTNDRIVGGKAAVPGSWPWQCSLRRKQSKRHLCGAVLVNREWLLTAAHCFRDLNNASYWTVHLGRFAKNGQEITEQMRYIKELVIHPKYSGLSSDPVLLRKKENDIALLKMNAPVSMTKYVRPVCLPPWLASLNPGTICHVTGWGETLGTGNADVLKQAEVPVVSQTVCQEYYSKLINVSRSMVCAGYADGGHDSCKGDSGGPLVVKKRNRWFVVGIVSTGADCAGAKQPGIYTKVSAFKFWISKVMWNV